MAKLPTARLCVALPKGSELRGTSKGDVGIELAYGEHYVQLAKDMAEGLRAKGYQCKVYITEEKITEC